MVAALATFAKLGSLDCFLNQGRFGGPFSCARLASIEPRLLSAI